MRSVEYILKFSDDRVKSFKFIWDKNKDKLHLDGAEESKPPAWADLDYNKCSNCPLDSDKVKSCPLAISFVNLVKYFDGMKSFEKCFLEVKMDTKTISQPTTVQKAISGMMGLVSAVSGCPHTSFFKPMAYFHMPLADKDSTMYRAASMYLLGQYFESKEGNDFDIELNGLKKIYENLGIVNSSIANRLRQASETDSTVNAIVTLDIYAKTAPILIERSLSTLKHLFDNFLKFGDLLK